MKSNTEKIHNALTNVDGRFITETEQPPRLVRRIHVGYFAASLAAFLTVSVILIAVLLTRPSHDLSPQGGEIDAGELSTPYEGYAVGQDSEGNAYVRIDEWNEIIPLPDEFSIYNDISIFGDKAWIVHIDQDEEKMHTYILTRGSYEVEIYSMEFDSKRGEDGYNVKYIDVFSNFYDEQNGSVLFWEYWGETTRIPSEYFFKTNDGGKSWYKQAVDEESAKFLAENPNWREHIVEAKMLNETDGIIYFDYNRESINARIFVTKDGGSSWSGIKPLPFPTNGEYRDYGQILSETEDKSNVESLEYADGEYLMTVKYTDEIFTLSMEFSSKDLLIWELANPYYEQMTFDSYDEILRCLRETYVLIEEGKDEASIIKELRIPIGDYYRYIFSRVIYDFAEYYPFSDTYYAFKDLNGDGEDEMLIFVRGKGLRRVFSNDRGIIRSVSLFFDPEICTVTEDGSICVSSHSKGEYGYDVVYRLSDDGNDFETVLDLITKSDEQDNVSYGRLHLGEYEELTREEYLALKEPYSEYFGDPQNDALDLISLKWGESNNGGGK